ncbi:MAG: hypothetical protein NTW32_27105 [Chloroflexi bacterium]|nr:hypothetical protein [Chloroflexota bacterium]
MSREEANIQSIEFDLVELDRVVDIFFMSFVITWYSMVEQYLVNLCRIFDVLSPEFSNTGHKNPCLEDIEYFFRAYKDEKYQNGYKINSHDIQELKQIRCLRNKLVHIGKDLPLKKNSDLNPEELAELYDFSNEIETQSLLKYLKQHKITDDQNKQIQLNADYCKYIIKFGEHSLRVL